MACGCSPTAPTLPRLPPTRRPGRPETRTRSCSGGTSPSPAHTRTWPVAARRCWTVTTPNAWSMEAPGSFTTGSPAGQAPRRIRNPTPNTDVRIFDTIIDGQLAGRGHWSRPVRICRAPWRGFEPVNPGRNAERETFPRHRCGRTLTQHPCGRTCRSGSQPQPGHLPHQPSPPNSKLGPHPPDRPRLLHMARLQVGRQVRKAELCQPRRPPRLPPHRLHPTPRLGRRPLGGRAPHPADAVAV